MNGKNSRRLWLQAGLFLAVMGLTFWFVFRNQDIVQTVRAVRGMHKGFLAAAFLLAFLFVAAEGSMIWYLLRGLGEKAGLLSCISYSFIGFFFSGLTPSATGGQPMQLYYMKRDGNSLSASSVVLMTVAVAYKLVLVLFGAGLLLFYRAPLKAYLGKYYGLYFIGLFLNVLLVALLLLVMFGPGLMERLFLAAERALVRLRLMKRHGAGAKKLRGFLDGYRETVGFLKCHKGMVAVVMAGTFLQRSTVFVLTWVVYKGLFLSGVPMADIMALQASVYIAVDMLPVPGAQGITEAMYASVFGAIFPGQYLMASMCITRGISFYAVMAAGLLVFLAAGVRGRAAGAGSAGSVGSAGGTGRIGSAGSAGSTGGAGGAGSVGRTGGAGGIETQEMQEE